MHLALLQVAIFLINTLFSFYISLVLLRFLLQWVKADFYNPYCQLLIKLTNFFLVPLRRVIPGFFGLDIAALVLIFLLQAAQIILLALLAKININTWLLIPIFISLLTLVLNTYFYAILVRAVLSWVNPDPYNPLFQLLTQLTEPVLSPIRKIIPGFSGFDLSPLVILILIQIILIFVRNL